MQHCELCDARELEDFDVHLCDHCGKIVCVYCWDEDVRLCKKCVMDKAIIGESIIAHYSIMTFRAGDRICAVFEDLFTNIQESDCGFGATEYEAIDALLRDNWGLPVLKGERNDSMGQGKGNS